MKYIFLTNSMGGYSGGPSYVRTKVNYLKEKGWDVQVFDSTGFTNASIEIPELKEFEDNRIQELFFNPFWLRKARREKVIATIIDKIGTDDRIVIESNTVVMSVWGELLASRIGAKHIVFLLSERLSITDISLYRYFKYKSLRGELFSINANAFKNLMYKFENFQDVEAEKHYWAAHMSVPIEDVECKELNSVEKKDFNIGHFGRKKSYFDYMFDQVRQFAIKHRDKSINYILLGVNDIPQTWVEKFPSNVHLTLIPSRQPIPKMFFDKCDVVVATAGCAYMAFLFGVRVISTDVYNNIPLGVLGYTTRDGNLRSADNHNNLSLSDTLENVLVKNMYKGMPSLTITPSDKGFDYHMTYVTPPDGNYYDVSHIVMPMRSLYTIPIKLFLFFNMVGACSKIRYRLLKK